MIAALGQIAKEFALLLSTTTYPHFLLVSFPILLPNFIFPSSVPHPTDSRMTTALAPAPLFKFNQGQTNSVRVENISTHGMRLLPCIDGVI
jgi:hypothetical protein